MGWIYVRFVVMMNFLRYIYVFAMVLCVGFGAEAFAPDVYAPSSVLSNGKWVKISVEKSGMHCISTSQLKEWGFSDPTRVGIYGYGGRMLSDVLSESTYIDDLPAVASIVTGSGLVFYAEGPQQVIADRTDAYHQINPYSNFGYYFLTEGPGRTIERAGTALNSTDGCQTEGLWVSYYNPQEVSIGNSGRMMVGEDFRVKQSRTFGLELPGLVAGSAVNMRISLIANSSKRTSIRIVADGTQLANPSSDFIDTNSESEIWGRQSILTRTFTPASDRVSLEVTLGLATSAKCGWLDYVELVYQRRFEGSQLFWATGPNVTSRGAGSAGTHVWDVTDPANHYEMNVGASGAWRNERAGTRCYAVWKESDAMPAPEFAGDVYNQNLHSMTDVPDMVIITPPLYRKAAESIAATHRAYPLDPLRVEVVDLDRVLNEFGSGSFDPGALRRFLKMLYDRGSDDKGRLRYVLMMGKGTCDNRALTSVGKAMNAPMPLWVSENSLGESTSFSTDDYFAYLEDDSGARLGRDVLSVAVGRIPATTAKEADIVAEKINRYLFNSPQGAWRTRMTILADDENGGEHMFQSENLTSEMTNGANGKRIIVNKIYCDAYERSNSTYPQARTDLFRDFSDGMAIFSYIGHGSPRALGSKGIIQATDFKERFYLKRLPFFYAATCSFLKWDMDLTSQAEALLFQRDGGLIGCISALRPVYITANGDLSRSFGKTLANFDADGSVPTAGELYRRAKNLVSNDTNKLRYVFLGDPALSLVVPANLMVLDAINGVAVNSGEPFTVMARQDLTISGRIVEPNGNLLEDFNGTATVTLYDAEFSTTSNGYGDSGKEVTFEEKGALLFVAMGEVKNGRFEAKVRMPRNIADNYRPATLSMFANSTTPNDLRTAAGVSNNIYAFGYDESTPADRQPPIIHSATLNDENFAQGDDVNAQPLLVARLSDNTGLNMSTAGVGQKMTLTIDGRKTCNDLSGYFVHDATPRDGAMSGMLYYPVPQLTEGTHTLQLRVFDIDGNFSDATIECNVRADLKPEIYEVYTTSLPARTEARFYVRHNRPDQIVTVTVGVYDLMGRHVWSGEVEGQSDMETSSPLVWDLRNEGGQRVPRGIYVYRVELVNGASVGATKSKKLAVAAE